MRSAPVVTGISPAEGPPGTRVTIRGENFGTHAKDVIGTSLFIHAPSYTWHLVTAVRKWCRKDSFFVQRNELLLKVPDHLRITTLLDISLWELCQNPIVLQRGNFKVITYPQLAFWSFLVLKRLDFDKVLTVKCQGVSSLHDPKSLVIWLQFLISDFQGMTVMLCKFDQDISPVVCIAGILTKVGRRERGERGEGKECLLQDPVLKSRKAGCCHVN